MHHPCRCPAPSSARSVTECGKAGGTKTILIEEPLSVNKRGNNMPDYKVKDIREAVEIIIQKTDEK